MKPSDLWITPEVGQYWFDTHALTVCKVTEVTDHSVMFDGKTSVVPLYETRSCTCGTLGWYA